MYPPVVGLAVIVAPIHNDCDGTLTVAGNYVNLGVFATGLCQGKRKGCCAHIYSRD